MTEAKKPTAKKPAAKKKVAPKTATIETTGIEPEISKRSSHWTQRFENPEISKPEIFAAMLRVQAAIPAIGKNKKNVDSGYAARSIDDVLDALHSVLVSSGVFVTVDVRKAKYRERESVNSSGKISTIIDARLTVRYTFYAEDGSSVSSKVTVEGRDYADKGSTKALSQAYKYAMLQTFSIALSEHDPDVDGTPTAETETDVPVEVMIVQSTHPDWIVKKEIETDVGRDEAKKIWSLLVEGEGVEEIEGQPFDPLDALLLHKAYLRSYKDGLTDSPVEDV